MVTTLLFASFHNARRWDRHRAQKEGCVPAESAKWAQKSRHQRFSRAGEEQWWCSPQSCYRTLSKASIITTLLPRITCTKNAIDAPQHVPKKLSGMKLNIYVPGLAHLFHLMHQECVCVEVREVLCVLVARDSYIAACTFHLNPFLRPRNGIRFSDYIC